MKNRLPGFSVITVLIIVGLISLLSVASYFLYINYLSQPEVRITQLIASENSKQNDYEGFEDVDYIGIKQRPQVLGDAIIQRPGDITDTTKTFNILILGLVESTNNSNISHTDAIHLITISKDRTKVVTTHLPKDIWTGTSKINGVFTRGGINILRDEVFKITGQYPDRYIKINNDSFVWFIDALEGLEVDVPNGFTDSAYPGTRLNINEESNGFSQQLMSIHFDEGQQFMDGETALMYMSSLPQDETENNDFARGIRQRLIMDNFFQTFFERDVQMFSPRNHSTAYQFIKNRFSTDISADEFQTIYEIAENYENIESSYIGLNLFNYLEVPTNRSPYLGAWVLLPKDGSYQPLHSEILRRIN